ncbi:hypothetical protein MH117_00855 [Paenibacillus sp. ACRRX]|uniref:helix-turn-helix domain-containing protein n=1 Tax=unclassified Paenibacillus TaxID=185978 RepID=UPI001EF4AABE|nr:MULTISPECIES: helix-turn-helix domain-containing protein [unclassified Paenibacillus]MCG7405950.1 hypothetical protein [Paenibacillus sp. ACRRX]MDK8182404.1 leucine zipper domain-containing protein [Paenibacillus sp. UMB4589-SE434]
MNEKHKYQIIMHGITSNNVAKTCKEFGISRTIYYQWYNAYIAHGMEGLAEKTRRSPNMPNQVDKSTEKRILQHAAKFPEDGPKRISYELQDEGINVGESGIYNVLRRNRLSKRKEREAYAEEVRQIKRSNGASAPKRRQYKPQTLDFKMTQASHAHPGYMCLQSITYMGEFPKIGRVYQYVIYDVYSRLVLVKLYNRKDTIHIIDFMQFKVIPLIKTFHFRIEHLVTNKSLEFTTNWEMGTHKYTELLHKYNIQQITVTAGNKEVFLPLDQFLTVLTQEFYEHTWIDDKIDSFEVLEKRLAEYMNKYNFSRPITDGPNQGKIPSDVVLEYNNQKELFPLWLFTRR